MWIDRMEILQCSSNLKTMAADTELQDLPLVAARTALL